MKAVIDQGAKVPVGASPSDSGLDFFCTEDIVIPANSYVKVETGVHVQIPEGCVGLLTSKYSLMMHGITCQGTIGNDYTGAIQPVVFNHSNFDFVFKKGDKVVRMTVVSCLQDNIEIVDAL